MACKHFSIPSRCLRKVLFIFRYEEVSILFYRLFFFIFFFKLQSNEGIGSYLFQTFRRTRVSMQNIKRAKKIQVLLLIFHSQTTYANKNNCKDYFSFIFYFRVVKRCRDKVKNVTRKKFDKFGVRKMLHFLDSKNV